MDSLTKYSDDIDSSEENAGAAAEADPNVKDKESDSANLESEWENFEKMLAEGPSDEAPVAGMASPVLPVTEGVSPPVQPVANPSAGESSPPATQEPSIDPSITASVERHPINPYAYLMYLTQSASTSAEQKADAHAKLEAFLEEAAASEDVHADEQSVSGSGSEEESESESHSDHSPSASPKKKSTGTSSDKASEKSSLPTTSSGADGNKKVSKSSSEKASDKTLSRSKDGDRRRRSRSRRRSPSRRSRSRSRHRHRRRRSSSRSRHGSKRRRHGSRSRRRSSSRHRRRRSRSPHSRRHSPSRRGNSRRHRDNRNTSRRSRSRDRQGPIARRMEYMRKNQTSDPRARAPPPEDFKARMKRELQQAAKDAMLPGSTVTPQQALLQTMAAMHAKAQEITGVSVPKYYNPAAVNPLKYAEQEKKRKLLWSKAKDNKEHSQQMWQGTEVVADEKYRKLMGIKEEVHAGGEISEEQKRKQSELFAKLDQEYTMARMNTHTHRGMGLGVVSQMAVASQQQQQQQTKPP